jgi:hypothetical protein
MVRCLVSAARPGIHRVRICILQFATRQAGLWILMAGGAAARIRGPSTSENPCGSHFHQLYLRMFIHPAPCWLIHRSRQQELLWMMARQISMRLPMNVGTISPLAARKAASCVRRDRALARLPVLRNGFSRRVRTVVFIRSTSASLPSERRPKVRSTLSVMRMKVTRW